MRTRSLAALGFLLSGLTGKTVAQTIPTSIEPYSVELREIVTGVHIGRIVRTRGRLSLFRYPDLMAFDRGPTVVVVPMSDDVRNLVGRWVEMVGWVKYRGDTTWPPYAIVLSSIMETAPPADFGDVRPASRLADLSDGGPSPGDAIVVGRFCGANLCGGLTGPPPSSEAWVLQDGAAALWVTGHRPRGKGWSLDPTDAAETRHWVEVVGRFERCGALVCLRANRLRLTASPE